MKFTRPLYRELFALDGDTRTVAVNTFKERASFYHPICRSMVAKDLNVNLGERERDGKFLCLFCASPCVRTGLSSRAVESSRWICFFTERCIDFVQEGWVDFVRGGRHEKENRRI